MAAALLFGMIGTAAAETKIVYANYQSAKHPLNIALGEFFEDVERETNGSVTFEHHPAASLMGGKALPSGVRDGVIDAGYLIGAYVPSEMPVDVFLGAVGLFAENPLIMSAVNVELVTLNCPQCTAEYDTLNARFFATIAITPYRLQCRDEVKTLEDIQGLKVRAIGPWANMVRAIGAVPFNISSNEIYEAMERGTLDCAGAALSWQRIRSLSEVAKYVVMEPHLGAYMGGCMFCLRQDKWEALTDKEKGIMLKYLPDIVSKSTIAYIEDDNSAVETYSKTGTKFYDAGPELAKAIQGYKDQFRHEIVAYGKERGIKDPQAIADASFRLIDKWTKIINSRDDWDRESYAKVLYDEVYSKIEY
jgi:TRAP-type C4-dicarboxylate transport system substrate-binding protein